MDGLMASPTGPLPYRLEDLTKVYDNEDSIENCAGQPYWAICQSAPKHRGLDLRIRKAVDPGLPLTKLEELVLRQSIISQEVLENLIQLGAPLMNFRYTSGSDNVLSEGIEYPGLQKVLERAKDALRYVHIDLLDGSNEDAIMSFAKLPILKELSMLPDSIEALHILGYPHTIMEETEKMLGFARGRIF